METGCRRMAWLFDSPDAIWPALGRVPLTSVLRVEHVVPDFQDLSDWRSLRAVPSNTPDTVAERHAQRFFTIHFYPFTSRVLNPGSEIEEEGPVVWQGHEATWNDGAV